MALRPIPKPVNPPFNLARQFATVTAPPPFDFSGVVMRFFPLKADFLSLARFCDHFLNIAPEFVRFRPSMPFVMLGVINYGKMSMEAGNLGWTSQNELLFSIPLDRYRPEGNGWVYDGAAQVAPFIFVDNESSQIGGREVYGWPKVQGWFTPEKTGWSDHPRHRRRLLSLETRVFKRLYTGERLEPQKLLSIEEEPPLTYSVVPPIPKNPLNPAVGLSRAVVEWSELLMKSMEMVTALPMQGYSEIDRPSPARMLQGDFSAFSAYAQNYTASTVNLKQFRDSAQPGNFCYQALTNARMEITQLRHGGMLGDLPLLQGDPGAGFSIFLHRYASLPIVDTLGLEVAGGFRDGDVDVSMLHPVMPFWLEVDLRYLEGENICWRAGHLPWRNDSVELDVDHSKMSPIEVASECRYNTSGSEGLQVATGPFLFPETTLRALPLLADPACLQHFCDAYLNEPGRPERFKPFGRYVYLMVKAYGDMSSETNNMGLWAGTEVNFAVPVVCERDGLPVTLGYVAPFMYTSSSMAATRGREVNGWTTIEAEIESPPNQWLGSQGPFADLTPLMRLSTDVFPALGVGQRSEWRTIIEIADGQPIGWQDQPGWNQVAEGWGKEIKRDVESMAERAKSPHFNAFRALALEGLANQASINQFSLKQFRDTRNPNDACYQSIVRASMSIRRVHDIREIERPLQVTIHRYPTQAIVDMLGLKVHSQRLTKHGVADCLIPSRPVYMKLDLASNLGEKLCWRAGSLEWQFAVPELAPPVESGERSLQPQDLEALSLETGPSLVDFVDQVRPQRLRDTQQRWVKDNKGLNLLEALAAVRSDLEPQMVVHAMLSREWENWGNPRWYQNKDQLPLFVVRRDSVGSAAGELFPVEESVPGEPDYWTPPMTEEDPQ